MYCGGLTRCTVPKNENVLAYDVISATAVLGGTLFPC
jgi:hypothetical protein